MVSLGVRAKTRWVVQHVLPAVLVWGCGGGGETSPVDPTPPSTPSIALAVSAPTPANVTQGQSATATVTLTRSGGYTGTVTLSVEGAPSGMTVTPAAATLAGTESTTALSIQVALSVPEGTYPLVVRATGAGVSAQTATLSVPVVVRPASLALARANSNALSLNAGGLSQAFVVVVQRIEYLGTFVVEPASALPAGITATFDPPSTGSSATVTIAAAGNAAPGSYTLALRAVGSGVTSNTLSVPVTVQGPAAIGVAVSRSTLSMPPAGSSAGSIVLTRTNTNAAISLAWSGLPSGVTAVIAQNPTASPGTTFTLTAEPTTPPGSYPVTLTGTAPSAAPASATFTLLITPVGSGDFTVRFCGAPSAVPIWFGFASGRNWNRVLPTGDNSFSFDLGSQGTVGWVTQQGADDYRLVVYAGTRDEVLELTASTCPNSSNRTATGSVTGLTASDLVQVVLGPRASEAPVSALTPTFRFERLPAGPLDLVATRASVSGGTVLVDRVLLQRGLTPANGGSVGSLSFTGAAAIATESSTLTVNGVTGSEQLSTGAGFFTAGGAYVSLGQAIAASATSGPYRHLPLAQQVSGDYLVVQATATAQFNDTTVSRSVSQLLDVPAPTTLTLPASTSKPIVFVAAQNTSRARFRALIPFHADYNRLFSATWSQQAGATRREAVFVGSATMVPETVGSNGHNFDVSWPDFTAANGFDPLWEMRPATPTQFFVSAAGWTASGGVAAPRAHGVMTRTWSASGRVEQ